MRFSYGAPTLLHTLRGEREGRAAYIDDKRNARRVVHALSLFLACVYDSTIRFYGDDDATFLLLCTLRNGFLIFPFTSGYRSLRRYLSLFREDIRCTYFYLIFFFSYYAGTTCCNPYRNDIFGW